LTKSSLAKRAVGFPEARSRLHIAFCGLRARRRSGSLPRRKCEPSCAQHLEKADAFFKVGKYEAATAEYAKAIKSGDSNVNTFNSWGVALRRLKRYDDAIEKYKQAASADPNNADAYFNWGYALFKLKSYGEVIGYYHLHLPKSQAYYLGHRS
jgi:tetratricopeptide (TPR) repeat protein